MTTPSKETSVPLIEPPVSLPLPPISISFTNINYSIDQSAAKNRWRMKSFPYCQSVPKKKILDNVTGCFTSGMNAILGPTGCGKSTLLDILADRKDRRGLSGDVRVSGQVRPAYFKYVIGYVIQDDVISETLTVRENLLFSANVRLPRSISRRERVERVNQVLKDLDLQSCAETLIGTDFTRGVSGGEKKRTTIGMELVLSPNVLFLDEPTTGLDASTAQNVMNCLYQLSRQGRTVIFSIHQPRYSIFKLFDQVLFLASGSNIYVGSPLDVLPYFASLGFNCEEHDNPADFVLDLLIQSNTDLLHDAYRQSSSTIVHSIEDEQSTRPDLDKDSSSEFYYLARRTLRNVVRNPALLTSQVFSVIIYGLFTGLIFHRLEQTVEPGVYNRFGAIFFIISCQVLTSMSALETLIKERALFIHENASGYYRVSSFFLAKLFVDVPLVHMFPSLIYSLITYFLTDLRRSSSHFLLFLLTNLMAKFVGSAMCYFVAASTSTFGVALVMVICGYVTMMLFSGFLIDLQSIVGFLRWMQWFSVFRYASNVLSINEFRNLTLCLSAETTTEICLIPGEEILTRRHISHRHPWDLWKNLFALVIIALTFFLFSFLQLLRMKKYK